VHHINNNLFTCQPENYTAVHSVIMM